MAMNGLQMMLKSMGFDPIEITNKISTAGLEAQRVIAHFDARLIRIEAALDILVKQNAAKAAIASPEEKVQ